MCRIHKKIVKKLNLIYFIKQASDIKSYSLKFHAVTYGDGIVQ